MSSSDDFDLGDYLDLDAFSIDEDLEDELDDLDDLDDDFFADPFWNNEDDDGPY